MAVDAASVTVAREDERRAPRSGRPGPLARWRSLWPGALALLPLGLLALASWYGRHVRPSADEWCFLPVVREDGISGLIGKFWFTDNGRLANGLMVGLYTKFPVGGHQWFGLVSGLVMLVLLWALIAQVLRRTGQQVPRGVPLLVSAMVCAVFLFATPNTYKTFYWPAASVSHTVAPVLACAAALPLLCARGRSGRAAALVTVAGSGVFMGTLSEETSVVALVVLSGVVLFAHRIFAGRARRSARVWSLAGMAGIAVGTLLLVTSPGSRNRRERYGAESTSMLAPESLLGSLRGYAQILETVLTTWQYAGAVAAGVLLGLMARGRRGGATVLLPPRPLFLMGLGTLAFLVSGYLCTVITYPVFGAKVVTTERTWNDYLLLYVLLLVAAGAFAGRALRPHLSGRRARAATGVAAAVCAATVLGLVGPLAGLAHDMQVRAERWDRQDRYLREGAARGATELPYTPLSVGRMLEPFSQGGRRVWPAQCVADHYQLDKVTYSKRLP
ncbi:DUF6056 family protein [Streptomyces xantholiticus]|uniref:DUF6056 family protein n=1 Tax=Streptomyces xantholiticus TaxID=68285 RepID=UPI0016746D70|nr:DUF6056 family protein [Streptomyces xantholiticus]GGW52728.1 hypothetical protein GCM10010381_42810 [Streptomyces xantholiticus]